MEWRIRESCRGDFFAEYGGRIEPGVEAGYKPGYFEPTFVIYESSRFDTREEAERYIERKAK